MLPLSVCNLCLDVLRAKYKVVCVLFFLVVVYLLLSTSMILAFLSNVSGLPVLGMMKVCTFFGYLLTLFQLWLPIRLIFLVMTLVSYVSGGVYTLICHYEIHVDVPKLFLAYKQQFKARHLVALCVCSLMGIASCCDP